jgi:hypothetical protein
VSENDVFSQYVVRVSRHTVLEHLTAAVLRAARQAAILSPAEKVAYVRPAALYRPKEGTLCCSLSMKKCPAEVSFQSDGA